METWTVPQLPPRQAGGPCSTHPRPVAPMGPCVPHSGRLKCFWGRRQAPVYPHNLHSCPTGMHVSHTSRLKYFWGRRQAPVCPLACTLAPWVCVYRIQVGSKCFWERRQAPVIPHSLNSSLMGMHVLILKGRSTNFVLCLPRFQDAGPIWLCVFYLDFMFPTWRILHHP